MLRSMRPFYGDEFYFDPGVDELSLNDRFGNAILLCSGGLGLESISYPSYGIAPYPFHCSLAKVGQFVIAIVLE